MPDQKVGSDLAGSPDVLLGWLAQRHGYGCYFGLLKLSQWIVHDRPAGLKLYYGLDLRRSYPKAMWELVSFLFEQTGMLADSPSAARSHGSPM